MSDGAELRAETIILPVLFSNFDITTSPEADARVTSSRAAPTVNTRPIWWAWLAIVVCTVAVHSVTLAISPTLWQDEAQTIEHGRAVLDPNSDWAVTWNDSTNRPVRPWTYVGPVVQEIAFRAAHESSAGPRIASLLGAILAGTAALLWLLARGTPATVAWFCSCVPLGPTVRSSVPRPRPEGYALAIPLFAAALAWGGRRRRSRGVRALITPVVCGAMMTAALFTWATTIILIPFVLVELLYARFGKAPELRDVIETGTAFAVPAYWPGWAARPTEGSSFSRNSGFCIDRQRSELMSSDVSCKEIK